MKFPKAEMEEVLYSPDVVLDEIIRHRRWSVDHRLVFKRDGKLYETTYAVAATESQHEQPWDYVTEVECFEVAPVEVVKIEYKRVDNG